MLAGLVGGLGVAAPTAHSAITPAMQACLNDAEPSGGRVPFTIGNSPAAPPWHFFGHPVGIGPGDVVRLTASGSIKIGGWPWDPSFGPEGTSQLGDASFPAAQRRYALVGQMGMNFGNRDRFLFFGTNSGCIMNTTPQATFLYTIMNDSRTSDNSGSWSVVLRHYRA
ncbi:hypothetical protein DPM19_17510 [Actinomadura craniellae]|uniref:Uncharacterized protein n=1 Tax=Actinomadura craniellae TaxID=2231787 RepID=A0A365H729_9ACTN|nr:hypothetical protein DPM19_17510 [Actinomadura craniellae]